MRSSTRRAAIGPAVNSTIWGILALGQAGEPVAPATVRFVVRAQTKSGGFAWAQRPAAGHRRHGGRRQALVAAGGNGAPIARALAFLRTREQPDGGFELQQGTGSNVQSTAWAIQAFVAARAKPPAAAFGSCSGCVARTEASASPRAMRQRRCGYPGRRSPRCSGGRSRCASVSPLKPEAVARAEEILGSEAENWARVVSRGYSVNEHWTAGFADGSRAFLKLASIDPSPQWVRDEHHVFECVSGPFMPKLLGFDDGERPLLILEDMLPDARWPPPWQPGDVDAVLTTLGEAATATRYGWAATSRGERHGRLARRRGRPGAFPSTRPRRRGVARALAARARRGVRRLADRRGCAVHCDVRSDNLCLRDGHAVLLDWNHARIGNAAFDVAFWLPSLVLEGGARPRRRSASMTWRSSSPASSRPRPACPRPRVRPASGLPARAARGGAAVGVQRARAVARSLDCAAARLRRL